MKKFLAMMLITALVMSVCSFSFGTVYAADWTVTLNNFDGEGGVSTYDADNGATLPADLYPTKEGWYFAGWYKEAELTNLWFDGDTVTADTELFAKWVQLPGTVVTDELNRNTNITYVGGGGHAGRVRNWFVPGYPYNYIKNDQVLINMDVVITIDLNNCHNLYGAVINTVDSKVGSYRFSGSLNGKDWTTLAEVRNDTRKASDCTFAEGARYRFVKLETLGDHASGWWAHHKIAILGESNPATFTVDFVSEGEVYYSEKDIPENTAIAGPASDPVNSEGKEFDGWYYEPAFKTKWSADDIILEDTTLYSKWVEEDVTISYDSLGGSAVEPTTAEKFTLTVAPASPTKDNAVFCGWYTDRNCTNYFSFETDVVNGPMTLYAKWAEITTEASVNRNGGIEAISRLTNFNNKDSRMQKWFNELETTTDKNVQVSDVITQPIEVMVTLKEPKAISAIRTKRMQAFDYTISATNEEGIAWNDDGWNVLAKVTSNSELEHIVGVNDSTEYKYLKVSINVGSVGWYGFYAVEFFSNPDRPEDTIAEITAVSGATVSYEVTLADVDADAVVLVALYSGDDLVAVKKVNAADTSCDFTNPAGANKAKIFVWEDLVTIKPITMDEISF